MVGAFTLLVETIDICRAVRSYLRQTCTSSVQADAGLGCIQKLKFLEDPRKKDILYHVKMVVFIL